MPLYGRFFGPATLRRLNAALLCGMAPLVIASCTSSPPDTPDAPANIPDWESGADDSQTNIPDWESPDDQGSGMPLCTSISSGVISQIGFDTSTQDGWNISDGFGSYLCKWDNAAGNARLQV